MINETSPQPDRRDILKEKRGCNTELRFTFIRHTQKASGQVFSENNTGLSTSNISETGKSRAKVYGKDQLAGRNINKAYATEVDRTKETLTSAFEAAGLNPKILQKTEIINAFLALPGLTGSAEFANHYSEIMLPIRQQYINEHYPGKIFDELTPDEQEAAAEYAEELALEWYLSFGDARPDEKTPSPREQAASVAYKINRLVNMPDYMPGGKSIDLISAGHKTSTEAFLKYVIEQQKDGKTIIGFDSLEEIGGSLKILDSWDLHIKNDNNGNKNITLTIRRENGKIQEYGLNTSILNQLAKEYILANNIQPKKIDSIT